MAISSRSRRSIASPNWAKRSRKTLVSKRAFVSPPAEPAEPPQLAQQRPVVLVRLAEADAGVERDPFRGNTQSGQFVQAGLEEAVEFGNDPFGIVRGGLHRLRRPAHVHEDDARPGV